MLSERAQDERHGNEMKVCNEIEMELRFVNKLKSLWRKKTALRNE